MKLSIRSLSFSYTGSNSAALDDICLDITSGELLFLIGGNRSGKSTLLSCIAGLMPEMIDGDFKGDIQSDGHSPQSIPTGYVLQESEAYLFSRVREELSFPLQNMGLTAPAIEQKISDIVVEFFGIEQLTDLDMFSLSGGERQKVAIAAALIQDSPLLLLDEPFEQLDPDTADELLQHLRIIADQGKAVIVAVRSFDYAAEYADRVVLLKEGRIVAEGTANILEQFPLLMSGCAKDDNHPAWQASKPVSHAAEPLIITEHLSYMYNGNSGIKDIDLMAYPGEILAVMGPNGAGKSTLIKHFIGLLKAQSGKVLVNGHDAASTPVFKLAQTIGILFQNPDDQIFNERIDKEIAWSLKAVRSLSWDEALRECQTVLTQFGLDEIKHLHPYSVSRSYRQLIALASVVVREPEILILDEPGKSLDSANTFVLMDNLLQLYPEHTKTIIMVTHDPYLVWRYADRMVLLAEGKIIADGKPAAIFKDTALTRQAKLSTHPLIKKLQKTSL